MFNKTRNRLVLFNSITLFLLLNLLGAIMYMVTSGRLYTQVDQTLYEQIESLDTHRIEELLREGDAHLTRPISLMVWDDDLNLIKQTPAYFFSNGDDWDDLKKYTGPTKAFNVKVDNHSYRILNSHQPGATFQFIYDLGTEKSVLNSLLITILIVDIISILLSVVIGVFMAQRALVPIKKAWDKQQQFVSDASHELRTPLTVLQVQLDRLFRHPFHTIEKESQKISVMMDETKRMSRLVEDLLTLARSDSHQLEIMKNKLDIQELLAKIANEFSDLAQLNNITVQSNHSGPLNISGDRERLHQLFVILIDNAIKYTEGTGIIKITSEQIGKTAKITICDTGIGIPEEDLPHIFERFYRVNKARTRAEGGTGLGLSIAQWIVQAHNGTIDVKSRQGKGSCFFIQLPIEH